jgi:LacI family transcriptional regulator
MSIRPHRSVTMQDVAAHAGVALKTVSRVVNDEPGVSAETRERVDAAVRALGYVPNASARRLAGGHAGLIGLVAYTDLRENTNPGYLAELQRGALARCREEGHGLLLQPWTRGDDAQDLEAALRLVEQRAVDGLILTPPADSSSLVQRLRQLELQHVLISPREPDGRSPSVGTTDCKGAHDMTRHLLSLGHRRIAFVTGPRGTASRRDRLDGFIAGLRDAGREPDPGLIVQGDTSFRSGLSSGRVLLDRAERPTAVFAWVDEVAAGVLAAAHQLGLRVPEDVSIAGCNDVPMARQTWPALTTVRQPIADLGAAAAGLILRGLRGESIAGTRLELPTELVIRETTANAPR